MNLIVCLDDRLGMAFNRRRQSRDRLVTEDIARTVGKGPLRMAAYSRTLFEAYPELPCVGEDFLSGAKEGDWVFLEDRPLGDRADRLRRLVIYRWNRHYPSDLTFDLDPLREGFRLTERTEFGGYSHETITKEIFER